jgi:hypothetical protein
MREMISSLDFTGTFGVRLLKLSEWKPAYRLEILDCLWNFAEFWCRYCADNRVSLKQILQSLNFLVVVTDNPEFLELLDDNMFVDIGDVSSRLARMTRCNLYFEPPSPLEDPCIPKCCLKMPSGGPDYTYSFEHRQRIVLKSLEKLEERCFKTASLGRILCETLPSDQRLALLSKRAPLAAVKWQKGRQLGRGATGTVFFLCQFKFA